MMLVLQGLSKCTGKEKKSVEVTILPPNNNDPTSTKVDSFLP